MKEKMKKWPAVFLAITMAFSLLVGCESGRESGNDKPNGTKTESSGNESDKPVHVKAFICWNGSSSGRLEDEENNPVAKKIKEATNVVFNFEFATSSEVENLNLMFAAGDVPYDVVAAPYWGGDGGETGVIKKAGKQGMLLPLNDLLDQYGENIKPALSTMVAKDFYENDVRDPDFNGNIYVVPYQTAAAPEDVFNWGYTVYARKDIMEALGWKPEDFNHSEKIYEFLKEVKAGDFKDATGNPVIPAGNWHNGWAYGEMIRSFSVPSFSGFFRDEDGSLKNTVFSPMMDEEVKFMHKMVSEGLFDPEAFRQNDTIAKEKHAVGRYAVSAAHYPHFRDFFRQNLLDEHPEMEYVPVGPIEDSSGSIYRNELKGRAGTPAWFIPKNSKVAEHVIKAINYMNSDEGKRLLRYGVEGIHYDMNNGKPVVKPEWLKKMNAGETRKIGIGGVYLEFMSLTPSMSQWGEFTPGEAQKPDPVYEKIITEISPYKFYEGYRASYFAKEYPKYEEIRELTDGNTRRDYIERAYFAKTQEEALKILNEYRNYLLDGDIEKYWEFMDGKSGAREDILW